MPLVAFAVETTAGWTSAHPRSPAGYPNRQEVGRAGGRPERSRDGVGGRVWCELRVRGHLDDSWSAWFEGLTIANGEDGVAILTGSLVDQAALHGVLIKVRDLGLPLLAVNCDERDDQGKKCPPGMAVEGPHTGMIP